MDVSNLGFTNPEQCAASSLCNLTAKIISSAIIFTVSLEIPGSRSVTRSSAASHCGGRVTEAF